MQTMSLELISSKKLNQNGFITAFWSVNPENCRYKNHYINSNARKRVAWQAIISKLLYFFLLVVKRMMWYIAADCHVNKRDWKRSLSGQNTNYSRDIPGCTCCKEPSIAGLDIALTDQTHTVVPNQNNSNTPKGSSMTWFCDIITKGHTVDLRRKPRFRHRGILSKIIRSITHQTTKPRHNK